MKRVAFIIIISSIIMLSVFTLSEIMLCVIMMNVLMLSVIMLSFSMLSVMGKAVQGGLIMGGNEFAPPPPFGRIFIYCLISTIRKCLTILNTLTLIKPLMVKLETRPGKRVEHSI